MINRCIVAILALTLLLTMSSSAQEIEQNKLTVYGKVRVFAKADRATITFTVKGEGKSLAAAFEQANTRIDSVALRLTALGLDDKALATSFFQSTENFGNKAFLSSKRDYKAAMTATITTDKMELLESLVIALSESDIESIDDIQFSLVAYEQIKKDALVKAVTAAREKADLICTELEIKRGPVLEFEELRGASDQSSMRAKTPFNAALLQGGRGVDFYTDTVLTSIYPIEMQFDAEVRIAYSLD